MRNILDSRLAILGGLADVLRKRADNVRELFLEGLDNIASFVERKRCLCQIGNTIWIRNFKRLNFPGARYYRRDVRRLAQSALNFIVIAMANKHQRIALLRELDCFDVNLGDERAGGVNHFEIALFRLVAHCRRNPMCTVDDAHSRRNLVDVVDENCALFGQLVDDKAIVDNLLANIDGSAKGFEGDLYHVNSADYARAEAARLEQENTLGDLRGLRLRGGG